MAGALWWDITILRNGYLSDDDPRDVLDTTDEMTGVFFYEPKPAGMKPFVSIFAFYF